MADDIRIGRAQDQDAVRLSLKTRAEPGSGVKGPGGVTARGNPGVVPNDGDGLIDISTSKTIQQTLSPEAMEAERRTRVEELKKAVQSNTYRRSSEEIAGALLEEVNTEIRSMRGRIPE